MNGLLVTADDDRDAVLFAGLNDSVPLAGNLTERRPARG